MKNKNYSILLINFNFKNVDGIGRYTFNLIGNLLKSENLKVLNIYVEKCNLIYIKKYDWFKNRKINLIIFNYPQNALFRSIYKFFFPPIKLLFDKIKIVIIPAPPCPLLSLFCNNTINVVHDISPLVHKRGQKNIFRIYYFIILLLYCLFGKKIVSVSKSTKNDLSNIFPFLLRKTIVSYNTVDKIFNHITKNKTEKYFLIVSTIQPGKNIESAIKAFSNFYLANNDFTLIIVGKYGWGDKEIYNLPVKLNIDNNVKFVGYLSNKDLATLYSKAWCLVNVSFYEGFGLPLIEAMKYGCPSIVSNISSLPEVAGPTSINVNPNCIESISNAMIKISDFKVRTYLSQKTEAQLNLFDSHSNTRKFLNNND